MIDKFATDTRDTELSSPAARSAGKGIHQPCALVDSLPLRFASAGTDTGSGEKD